MQATHDRHGWRGILGRTTGFPVWFLVWMVGLAAVAGAVAATLLAS